MVEAHNRKPRTDAAALALFQTIGPLNSGLDAKREEITNVAQEFIHYFDPELSFSLDFGLITTGPRTEPPPKGYIHLKVRHKGRDIAKHTDYLNEARLSAIALCLHFAVLKTMPLTALKVLILDDVLLGLDMENRLPVLKLLEERFQDWQTLMLTYDTVWFDMIQQWGETRNWGFQKIHRFGSLAGETTLRELNDGLVGEARRQLSNGDIPSAANMARSAAESVLKRYFDRNDVEMPYKKKQKDLSFNDFWNKALTLRRDDGTPYVDAALKRRLEGARALILNPASHDPTIPLTTREVQEAIDAVKALADAFGIASP